jgi:hypothetical protein
MAKTVDLTVLLKAADTSAALQEPIIEGKEDDVDQLIEKKRACDRIAQEFGNVRRTLEVAATTFRNVLEEQGTFHTVVKLKGSHDTVEMSYTDQCKALTCGEADAVEKAIGKKAFGNLFEKTKTYALTGDDKQLAKLRKLIKAAGEDPDEYLAPKECYKALDGFRKSRFELRPRLSDTQNAALDLVISRIQYEPRLGGVKWAETPNGNGKKQGA